MVVFKLDDDREGTCNGKRGLHASALVTWPEGEVRGASCNGSNDLVRQCVTSWACQTQQCWQPQSLNQTVKIPETMTGHASITDTSI